MEKDERQNSTRKPRIDLKAEMKNEMQDKDQSMIMFKKMQELWGEKR